ncbi:hypothetical protein AQ505_03200 [Pedobacter sp. PACM 27299]|nr:hypothetical protein AQ505_03200 [Pedobacter sp. PACM 27299]
MMEIQGMDTGREETCIPKASGGGCYRVWIAETIATPSEPYGNVLLFPITTRPLSRLFLFFI